MIWILGVLVVINLSLSIWLLWRLQIIPKTPKITLLDQLTSIHSQLKTNHQNLQTLKNALSNLDKNLKSTFASFGLVRFSAFGDIGTNQSFSLAILNPQHSGFILTSIYTKDGSRLYIKPVNKGKPEINLSPEEQEALAKAKRHLKLVNLIKK